MMETTTDPRSRRDRQLLRGLALASAVLLGGAGLAACSGDDAKKVDGTTTTSIDTSSTTDTPTGSDDGSGGGGNSGGGSNGGSSGNSGNTGGGSAAPAFGSVDTPENIDCHNGDFQEFTASWTTTNATRVTISIDGPGVYKEYPANGSDSLPFNCSSSHTFLFTAYNADGATATRTITLDPRNVQTPSSEDDEESTTTTA